MANMDPGLRARNIVSAARWRWIFAALSVALPLTLGYFFDRNNGRLRALADHGALATATVTTVTRQGGVAYTEYAYEVGGRSYDWNVGHEDAPFAPGQEFPVRYLPEVPSFSRPAESYPPARLLGEIRLGFQRGMLGGMFAFFALAAVWCEATLRRLRRDEWQPARVSPDAVGRVLGGVFYAISLGVNLDPKVQAKMAEAFGATLFGLPVAWAVTAVEMVAFAPLFWVCVHLMRLVMAHQARGGSMSRAGVVMAVVRAEPALKRSRAVVVAGAVYFAALMAGWIAYAAHRGI